MFLEPQDSLPIGSLWMAVIAVFNTEIVWLACLCCGVRDRPRRRCLILSLPAKRKGICWRGESKPSCVRKRNGDMQRENLFVWQQVEGIGREVNLTLMPGLWSGEKEYNPQGKESTGKRKTKVERDGMMNSEVRSCCRLLSCSNYPLN